MRLIGKICVVHAIRPTYRTRTSCLVQVYSTPSSRDLAHTSDRGSVGPSHRVCVLNTGLARVRTYLQPIYCAHDWSYSMFSDRSAKYVNRLSNAYGVSATPNLPVTRRSKIQYRWSAVAGSLFGSGSMAVPFDVIRTVLPSVLLRFQVETSCQRLQRGKNIMKHTPLERCEESH